MYYIASLIFSEKFFKKLYICSSDNNSLSAGRMDCTEKFNLKC